MCAYRVGPARLGLLAVFLAALGFGGCAQQPQQMQASHGREYFPSSVYGPASRRVVADGQPVPHGGGQYLVGKPYTIAGRTYYPSESRTTQVGYASWYGDAFHGRLTANGEIYDRDGFTAASPTMPLPSYARVTNLRNNFSMIVRVNDRGPYASNRIMDVSRRVAESLDFKRYGTTQLKVEYVGRASLDGSDDAKLYATLRTDGPASRQRESTMVAEAPAPRARVASLAPYAAPREEIVEETYIERPAPRQRAARYAERPEPAVYEERRPARRVEAERDETLPRRSYGRVHVEEERHLASYRPAYRDLAPVREARGTRFGGERRFEDMPPARPSRIASRGPLPPARPTLPPSRPMDLGTIPGAASQIHAHHAASRLHMARARDD